MEQAYLGLGTNMGNRTENLVSAIHLLEENGLKVLKHSSVYETSAWGFESETPFYNMVVQVSSEIEPFELLRLTQKIEKQVGRTEKTLEGYQSRIIDIDILFIDAKVINTDELRVPHKFFESRKFVLVPMNELNPLFINVLTNQTMEWHLLNCTDSGEAGLAVTNIDFAKKL